MFEGYPVTSKESKPSQSLGLSCLPVVIHHVTRNWLLMQRNKYCFQWLAGKKKRQKELRGEEWEELHEPKGRDGRDGWIQITARLGFSPGSFILLGVHPLKGVIEVVPFPYNRQTRLLKIVGTLLGNSPSVKKKLGNSCIFMFVFLKQLVIAYEGFIILGKLKTWAKPEEGIYFIRKRGRKTF